MSQASNSLRAISLTLLEKLDIAVHQRRFFSPSATLCSFSSNDYLGLRCRPELLQAGCKGAADFGVGGGASRVVVDADASVAALEELFAQEYCHVFSCEQQSALYLNSGFMANLAFFDALAPHPLELASGMVSKEDYCLFLESSCHSSLHVGARLSGLPVRYFSQKKLLQLERILQNSAARFKVIVVESLHSMDGIFADLSEICSIALRYDATVFVDEAHSFGIFGANGLGITSQLPIELHKALMGIMFGMGKAAGCNGGILLIPDWFKGRALQKSRTLLYTTAAAPFSSAALLAGLKLIFSNQGDNLRQRLMQNIAFFEQELCCSERLLGQRGSPIKAFLCGSESNAMRAEEQCLTRGFLVKAIRPPTVPRGSSRLRIVIRSDHTFSEIKKLCAVLTSLV